MRITADHIEQNPMPAAIPPPLWAVLIAVALAAGTAWTTGWPAAVTIAAVTLRLFTAYYEAAARLDHPRQ